ncbi:hypothetical protein C8R44DRAFT_741646 [Mycena epipterygia]|nr:hypothetical protein C8R44DRAFT_741646 [Mycena epipterygia]
MLSRNLEREELQKLRSGAWRRATQYRRMKRSEREKNRTDSSLIRAGAFPDSPQRWDSDETDVVLFSTESLQRPSAQEHEVFLDLEPRSSEYLQSTPDPLHTMTSRHYVLKLTITATDCRISLKLWVHAAAVGKFSLFVRLADPAMHTSWVARCQVWVEADKPPGHGVDDVKIQC